jgi:hypothetical protein
MGAKLHEVTPELESRFYTGGAGGSNIAHIAYIATTLPPRASAYSRGCRGRWGRARRVGKWH